MQEQARYNSRYRPIDTNLPNIGTAEIVDKPTELWQSKEYHALVQILRSVRDISSIQQIPAGLSTLKKNTEPSFQFCQLERLICRSFPFTNADSSEVTSKLQLAEAQSQASQSLDTHGLSRTHS
ncbi:hypothetical protein TESG_08303 [Trichophyton tonsurans CBS 112818]|uniref:Uncharacterized protein n=1 Tax=Trichophyton tonsurans (strain CBS 112818) TaxID=647933 RepID=F2RR37_TRIT1|nr:hypothetical protein TESG_08303 [Trichophyton tonsurans CBS 112818]